MSYFNCDFWVPTSRHSLSKNDVTWRMVYRMLFQGLKICPVFLHDVNIIDINLKKKFKHLKTCFPKSGCESKGTPRNFLT